MRPVISDSRFVARKGMKSKDDYESPTKNTILLSHHSVFSVRFICVGGLDVLQALLQRSLVQLGRGLV